MNQNLKDGTIIRIIRRIYRLSIEDLKLLFAEKLTMLASGAVILVVGLIFLVIALAFLTVSIADLFRSQMAPSASYAIIGGGYILLAFLLFLFRNALVFNPISRFITKVILAPEDVETAVKQPKASQSHEEAKEQ